MINLLGVYHYDAHGAIEAAWSNKAMGFVVPQGRERMMGYGRFEEVVNALEGAVLQGEHLVSDSSTTHWWRSKPNRQLLRPKRDELNALDFDTSRHYPYLLLQDREVD
jgi:hypothetical protein